MTELEKYQIRDIVNINSYKAVLERVKFNMLYSYEYAYFLPVRRLFDSFIDMFKSGYSIWASGPNHTIFQAVELMYVYSCIIDGYNIDNGKTPVRPAAAFAGLVAAFLHDSSFLESTPTDEHTMKSENFIDKYFADNGLKSIDPELIKKYARLANLFLPPSGMGFSDEDEKRAGLIFAASNILAQCSSRTYLEKKILDFYAVEDDAFAGDEGMRNMLVRTVNF